MYQYRWAESVAVLPTDKASLLSIGYLHWSGSVTPCILLIGCSVIQCVLSIDIFKCMLGAAPRVGPFSLLVARPYSFLDVGLDFQAKPPSNYIIKMTQ